MSINAILPFVSAAIMIVFVVFVFQRFFARGQKKAWHLFIWGVGLTFYLLGSLMEALHSGFGWNPLVFRLWYLFGAVLVAAWLGQGTVQLLVRGTIFGKVKWATVLLVILTLGSLYATYKVFTAQLEPIMLGTTVNAISVEEGFDEQTVLSTAANALYGTAIDEDGEFSERELSPLASAVIAEAESEGLDVTAPESLTPATMPNLDAQVNGQAVSLNGQGLSLLVSIGGQPAGALELAVGREMHGHAIVSGGTRILTPFFNMYGLIWLVGGAIYSAYIFLRKRIMPNRVLGNVLIATGALMPGIGGLLSHFGLGGYLYVGELLGSILMFAGFIAATNRPEPVAVPQVEVAPTR